MHHTIPTDPEIKFKRVRVRQLKVDGYRRNFDKRRVDERRVRTISEHYSRWWAGYVQAQPAKPGWHLWRWIPTFRHYVIVDGVHRVAAAKSAGVKVVDVAYDARADGV